MLYQIESPYGKAEQGMSQAISTYGKRFRQKPKAKQNPAANIKSVVDAAKGAYKLKDLYNQWGADGAGDTDVWARDNMANLPDVGTPLESMGGGGEGVVDMSQEGLAWSRPETALGGGPAGPEAIATPAVTPGTPGGMPPTPAMPMAAPETAAAEVAQMAAPETAISGGAGLDAVAGGVGSDIAAGGAAVETGIAAAGAAAGAAEAGAVTMGVAGAAIPAAEAAALASTVGVETAMAAGSVAGPVGLIAGGLVAGIGSFLFS
ncbi:MAG: hypothetical protein DRH26_00115 [Deltaproteobacteria bacterium]|nr:MAG: hypothetical protein DRH26_00115 [Deltaproteobacteria bacterium]